MPQIDRYISLFLYCIGLCLNILVGLESGSLKEFKILLQRPKYHFCCGLKNQTKTAAIMAYPKFHCSDEIKPPATAVYAILVFNVLYCVTALVICRSLCSDHQTALV